MKKLLQQKINLGFTLVIALIMTLGLAFAGAYSLPGGSPTPLLHRGGGDQVVERLGLGATIGDNYATVGNFDARGPLTTALALFDQPQGGQNFVFSTLQNSFFLGDLIIGNTTTAIWNQINDETFTGQSGFFTIPTQKVNVIGNALATNLQNTSGQTRVCVEPDGGIVLCPEQDYFEYQCNAGTWSQPQYGAADGTFINGGIVQNGTLVFDDCPIAGISSTDAYDSNASYTTGNRVCATSTPNPINCSASAVSAYVCGVNNPGEWGLTSYGAQSCPFANHNNSQSYQNGDTVCAPSGIPDNSSCQAPAVPAYLCQATGRWAPSNYGAQTCPYPNYDGSVDYDNGDIVCSSFTTPNDNQCVGALNGQCGSANGGTFSTAPSQSSNLNQNSVSSQPLCANGEPSSVNDDGPFVSPRYSWTCAGKNGGTTDSCTASYQPTIINGQCNSFSGSHATQPANSSNGCDAGNYNDNPDNASQWQWSCDGTNGGSDTLCSADRISYAWDVGEYGACIGASSTTQQRIQFDVSNASGNHNICTNQNSTNPYQVPPSRSSQYNATPYVSSNGSTVTGTFAVSNYIDRILQDNGVPTGGGANTPSFTITFPDNNCTVGQFYCGGSGSDIYTRCELQSSTPGTQTRPVVCRDNNGNTVSNSLCPSPTPETTQSCN